MVSVTMATFGISSSFRLSWQVYSVGRILFVDATGFRCITQVELPAMGIYENTRVLRCFTSGVYYQLEKLVVKADFD